LITGASKGKGLGFKFLKHIVRTKILVFIVDSNVENIREEYLSLCNELEKYNKELMKKPKLLLLSKSDILDTNKTISKFKKVDTILISSVSNIGLKKSIDAIARKLQDFVT